MFFNCLAERQAAILLATAMAHQFSDEGLLTFSVHPGTVLTVYVLLAYIDR